MNKNSCDDIFKNTIVDSGGLRMYPKKTHEQFLETKMYRIKKNIVLQKIQIIVGLRCIKGMLYVRVALEKIKICKLLLTQEIEQG